MLLHKNTISNQMSMSITILGKDYDINLQTLTLSKNQLMIMPAEIVKLVNLQDLDLSGLAAGSLLVYNAGNQKWIATNTLEQQVFSSGQY